VLSETVDEPYECWRKGLLNPMSVEWKSLWILMKSADII
jgi:hypothetical protein